MGDPPPLSASEPPLPSDQGTPPAAPEPQAPATIAPPETAADVESAEASANVTPSAATAGIAASETPAEETAPVIPAEAPAEIAPKEAAADVAPSETPTGNTKEDGMALAAPESEITAQVAPASAATAAAASMHAERETFYRVKWTMDETGRSICIALQNENGPCAMLALLNIFLQRGTLTLPPGSTSVSESRAMSMLAELALTADTSSVQHFVELLPTLNRGMFVSPKFYAPTAFEHSKEMAAFSAFPDVRLMHGWLVDPQDEDLVRAFADLSYNQVMDELVRLSANGAAPMQMHGAAPSPPAAPPPPPPPHADPLDLIDVGLPPHLQASAPPQSPLANDNVAATVDDDATAADPSLRHDEAPNVDSEVNTAPLENGTAEDKRPAEEAGASIVCELPGDNCTAPVQEAFAPALLSDHAPLDIVPPLADDDAITPAAAAAGASAPSEIEMDVPPVASTGIDDAPQQVESPGIVPAAPAVSYGIARHAHKVWDFLSTFSTHLTYHGIAELNAQLREGDTCILFRNSHFYVLRKRAGELYTLCTDVGFLKADVAWEILRDINGDSDFYDALFHPALLTRPSIPPEPQSPPTLQVARARPQGHGQSKAQTPPRQPQRTAKRNSAAAGSSNGTYGAQGRHPRHQPSIPPGRRKPTRAKDESCVLQ